MKKKENGTVASAGPHASFALRSRHTINTLPLNFYRPGALLDAQSNH